MRLRIALLAALVLAVAMPAGAGASLVPSSIEVYTLGETQQFVDANRSGQLDPGDYQILRSELANTVPQFGRPAGALVGGFSARLSFVSDSLIRVRASFGLPGGIILVSGSFDPNSQNRPRRTSPHESSASRRSAAPTRL